MRCVPWLAVCVPLAFALPAVGQQPTRYVGRLANGQTITGAAILDWHAPDASPRLDNQPLLDPQNPFRWVRDRALPLAEVPEAFVETFTGDRLAGTVVEHIAARPESFDGLPSHFLVEPTVELNAPRPYFPPSVRVVEESLRRIVWRRRPVQRYEPGVAFFRDGSSFKFRAIRFERTSAVLLMEDGQKQAPFRDLAELHFPERDSWEAYFDELALLSPSGESRLLQIETTDGLIATTSRERTFPLAEGGPGDPARWLHGVQPAWSLDMLWAPHRNIVVRRSFAAHEVPLSRLSPRRDAVASPFRGAGSELVANRNAAGGTLESNGQEYGWGFGTLGGACLRFPLPDCAAALQGRVGLDRVAGAGGSIQARIFLDRLDGAPLWQSAPLVGTAQTTDWGSLTLPSEPGKRHELLLAVDPLLKNAPAGADPLDIRDLADWLDPLLLLDPQKTQLEISRRAPRQVYAWRDWSVEVDGAAPLAWQSRFELNPQFTGMRVAAASAEQPVRIVRKVKASDAKRWLVVLAEHPPGVQPRAKIEVRAGGELAAEWNVPPFSGDPGAEQALAIPLSRLKGAKEEIEIEIRQSATPKDAPVLWKAAAIASHAPMLFRVLDDDGEFAPLENSPLEALSFVTAGAHAGERAVRIAAGARFTQRLPREVAIRERPALGEFRFLRFALRKAGKGRAAVELHRLENDSPPIRYDAGLGDPSYGSAARVWSLELPDQWIVTTRDLFRDFGKADLAGLTLSVPDGECALFDSIYLARAESDFDLLPGATSPDETNREARRELAKNVLDRVVPATVAIDFGGRFSTGVLIGREGEVLTAGHAVVAPGKDVTVVLRDGRRLKGKTAGVARDFDLGLVRIEEKGEWPIVDIGDARNLPKDQLYVGVAHKRNVQSDEAPAAHVVGLQPALQGVIWSDFDVQDWSAGGPLVDKDARLIGVQRGRSQFGGFLYTQLLEFHTVLPRLKNGEVWGVWPPACGPMMGVHVETMSEGCRVTEVYAETPAVGAGLRIGDWIAKIDGRPVRRLDDIYLRLGETDPGQQVALELRRGSETAAATLPLIHRTP